MFPHSNKNSDKAVSSVDSRCTTRALATRPRQSVHQPYNLRLSEMRHYQDDDTIVLVLSQRDGAVEEAEYPIPLEQDTSEILDAEDDDVLAGYAEAATKLVKTGPQSNHLDYPGHSSYNGAADHRLYTEGSHEWFGDGTYQQETPDAWKVNEKQIYKPPSDNVGNSRDSQHRGTWDDELSPHLEPAVEIREDDYDRIHLPSTNNTSRGGAQLENGRGSSWSSISSKTVEPFFPSGPSVARVSNGVTPSRSGSKFSPSASGEPIVSNGVASRRPGISSSDAVPASNSNGRKQVAEDINRNGTYSGGRGDDLTALEVGFSSYRQPKEYGSSSGQLANPEAETFFPSYDRAKIDTGATERSAQFEWEKPAGVRGFFDAHPTFTSEPQSRHSSGDALSEDTRQTYDDRSPISSTAYVPARHHEADNSTSRALDKSQKAREVYRNDSDNPHDGRKESKLGNGASPPASQTDPRKHADDSLEQIQDEHVSKSYARAVSHSSFPSALPEHSLRSRSTPRNSAMRRSSRRDAHMQARIARLDTSNLSTYSVRTLRRLAKDMGLSNTAKLSKSELVVQLVSEIILANMSLGWGVPELSQGVMASGSDDEGSDEDYASSSDDEDATIYRFSSEQDADDRVEVEDAIPRDTLQLGRDSVERLERNGDLEVGNELASSHEAGFEHVDVDADFESLSKLSMAQLQELCEDMQVQGWEKMRKFEMISALLLGIYDIES